MILIRTFHERGDFAALNAAHAWCEARGISFGIHERGQPEGLLVGNFRISQWRNLSHEDVGALDGRLIGSREGPVEIYLTRRAAAAIAVAGNHPAT